jgi:hypothetical protein
LAEVLANSEAALAVSTASPIRRVQLLRSRSGNPLMIARAINGPGDPAYGSTITASIVWQIL